MKGYIVEDATCVAADFAVLCIERTMDYIDNHWYSVKIEACMKELVNI